MTKVIKFVEKRNLWFVISFTIIAIGFAMMVGRVFNQQPAMNFGIDFSGGTSIMLKFDELQKRYVEAEQARHVKSDVNSDFIQDIREVLAAFKLENSSIQLTSDGEVLLRTANFDNDKRSLILGKLKEKLGNYELLEVDVIGPTIGSELRTQSLWIMLVVMAAMMIYISWRFEFAFGIGALAALLHDTLMIFAVASIFHFEINIEFVAALLTVLGYSTNDTIVVFDRVRENLSLAKGPVEIGTLINSSIIQTFPRTINTVLTVLLVLVALLIFGGTTIKPFAGMLLVGIAIGTYSSIFIASTVLYSVLNRPKDA